MSVVDSNMMENTVQRLFLIKLHVIPQLNSIDKASSLGTKKSKFTYLLQ